MATKRATKRGRRKTKPDPVAAQAAIDEFICSVPEATLAALPAGVFAAIDEAATYYALKRPRLARRDHSLRMRALVARRVGWEFDQENCEAFMEMLLKYLPLFFGLMATKHPAIATALAA